MRWIRFLVLLILVLSVSCNLPRTAEPTVKPQEIATGVWTDNTFQVETKNLIIYYPDFVDPAEARRQADTLQKGYGTYRVIFAFDEELPYEGQKAAIVFDTRVIPSSTVNNLIVMGSVALNLMKEQGLDTSTQTILHEMGHVFENAQMAAGRYYFYYLIGGAGEALTEYFVCHPEIFRLWAQDARASVYCDYILHGIGAKGPEETLAYYEAEKIDPYTLNWGAHPAGPSGENFFEQMLGRISDKAGWDVWEKFFSVTKDSGGGPAAREAYMKYVDTKGQQMGDALIKGALAEFVAGLSQAYGQDLRPMFRGWGFDL